MVDQLWPAYERAALDAGIPQEALGIDLVLGGWSPQAGRMVATAYAKSDSGAAATVQPLVGGLASPGEPMQVRPDSFAPDAVLAAARIQAAWLNKATGRRAAGGRALADVLSLGQSFIRDLGQI